jgi:hypothetical protein
MAEPATDLLAAGNTALDAGDWATARAAFRAALSQGDEPDGQDG